MRGFLSCLGMAFVALAIGASLFAHAAWLRRPIAGEPIKIVVAEGDTYADVRDTLVQAKLVSKFGYGLYAKMSRDPERPKAGEYEFRKRSSYYLIARSIALGPERDEISVLIVEGKTIEDEAEALRAYDVDPEDVYRLAGRSKNLSDFDHALADDFEFLRDIPRDQSLEGYLFPDTYRVWKDELPQALIRKQLAIFSDRVINPLSEKQDASGMTWHAVITLASIVEAEVQKPEDRKIVAGIFLKRLQNSMRLQSDATLNYVIGEGRARATAQDLELDSPYNTYRVDGLPPGPINNPGLSAIQAVLEPTDSEYLYFLSDEEGRMYYAKTFEEHKQKKIEAFGS